jgi:hypothetical protein
MTVENMLEKSTGTLQDSMWAPHNIAKQNIGKPFPQRSGTAQQMAPAAKIENAKATERATNAWNTDAPTPSTAKQMQSNWGNQASQPSDPPLDPYRLIFTNTCLGQPSAAGLLASSWAVQTPQAGNSLSYQYHIRIF